MTTTIEDATTIIVAWVGAKAESVAWSLTLHQSGSVCTRGRGVRHCTRPARFVFCVLCFVCWLMMRSLLDLVASSIDETQKKLWL